jgi:cbb3-type cytochrome oxidase subunit 3
MFNPFIFCAILTVAVVIYFMVIVFFALYHRRKVRRDSERFRRI